MGTYAVLAKARQWNGRIALRMQDLIRRASGGDVVLLLDETAGPIAGVDFGRVLRYREPDLTARGFPDTPAGQMAWYNCDYALYHAFEALPAYQHYLMLDADSVARCDLDTLIRRAAADGVDYLGEPIAGPIATWPWLAACRDAWPEPAPVLAHLVYVTLLSRRAVAHLMARRLALAARRPARWPLAEAFLPTEMALGGFAMRTLSEYGRVPHLSWWPPYHPVQLGAFRADAFVHPVLTGPAYFRAMLRNGLRPALSAWGQMAFSNRPPTPVSPARIPLSGPCGGSGVRQDGPQPIWHDHDLAGRGVEGQHAARPPGVQDRDDAAGRRAEQVGQVVLPEMRAEPHPVRGGLAGQRRQVEQLPRQPCLQRLERGVLQQRVGAAQPPGHHSAEREPQARRRPGRRQERPGSDPGQVHPPRDHGISGSRTAIDHRDLAEQVAGAENLDHQVLAPVIGRADPHAAFAGNYRIDRIGGVPFGEHQGAVGGVEGLRRRLQVAANGRWQVGEHGDGCQRKHAPSPRRRIPPGRAIVTRLAELC
jgi:hypothetical protein